MIKLSRDRVLVTAPLLLCAPLLHSTRLIRLAGERIAPRRCFSYARIASFAHKSPAMPLGSAHRPFSHKKLFRK